MWGPVEPETEDSAPEPESEGQAEFYQGQVNHPADEDGRLPVHGHPLRLASGGRYEVVPDEK